VSRPEEAVPTPPSHLSPLGPPDDPEGDGLLVRPRPPRTWRERAEHVADATGTTPGRLFVGAALAAAAVVVGLWLTRPAPAPAEASLPFASTSVRGAGVVTTAPSTTEATEVVVDVEGAVVQPGVHRLPSGARVTDAVAAAGGLSPTADGARLNLAAPLQDGQRVYVPAVGQDPPPVVGPSGPGEAGASGEPTGPVNLNTADADALDALPGVGPATAAAIIEHRKEIGGYTSVEQLLDVRGIGEAKLDQLRPLVTV
jgi:competence protein ComEA